MITTPTLDPSTTLAALVTEDPSRAAALDRLGIDYCCHGDRTLADACATAGLTPEDVATALVGSEPPASSTRPAPTDAAALAAHIQATHHAYLHAELPALIDLAHKIRTIHGARHPELADVQRLVNDVSADLVPHLAHEEQVVFPAIGTDGGGMATDLPAVIAGLRIEHDALGVLLAELRATSDGYRVPADGCASYHALYRRLAHLEADTHLHIHLENNLLFPAVTTAAARAR